MKEVKHSPKMRALLKLKEMVQEMMDEDFKENRMPSLMALKVTKVEPKVEGDAVEKLKALSEQEGDEASEEGLEVSEGIEVPEEMECPLEEDELESNDKVNQLKKLLKK